MNSLTRHDLHFCVNRLPKALLDAMKLHGKRIVVAGGYVRSVIANELVNDIDCFAPDRDTASLIAAGLKNNDRHRIVSTDNAFTVIGHKVPIQFIHRWTFARPEDVVPSFDFTIARAAFWWDAGLKEWQSLCDETFYADLAAKRLVYTSPERNEDAGGSILRVFKFYQRGYRMPLDSMAAVIARLMRGVEPSWWRRFPDGLSAPAEAELAKKLCGLLREVDPNVDPDHIMHLPSLAESELALDGKEAA